MKKTGLLIVFLFIFAELVAGCAPKDTATEVIVDQSALYAEAGTEVRLPFATVEYEGKAADGSVTCKVYTSEKMVAEYSGGGGYGFTPESAGIYIAEYMAEYKGESSRIKQVRIIVSGGIELKEGMPRIELERSEAVFASYSDILLRAASGKSSQGKDISAHIKVRLIDAESRELFFGKGNVSQKLGALGSGTYVAVYTLECDGITAVAAYNVKVVGEENAMPSVSSPTTDIQVFAGQTVSISSARASDPVEGDISASVKVRIEDGSGKVLLPDTAANKKHSYVFETPGEYKVIYTCANSKGRSASSGYGVTVRGTTSSGIMPDGVIDETEYGGIPAYRTGLGGNVRFYFHRDGKYLYIAASVKDSTLIVSQNNDKDTALNCSDGLEVMIDPANSDKLNAKGTECVRIRIGADGSSLVYIPSKNGAAWEKAPDLDMSKNTVIKAEGSFSYNGITRATDPSAADIDTGYTVELRIPWEYLGFSSDPMENAGYNADFLRIAFGHRDVSSPQYNNSYAGVTASGIKSGNNTFYNGMNYIGRDEVATLGLAPAYYSKLYLRGSLLGVDPAVYSSELILDGYMESEFWQDAQRIPYGATGAGSEVDAFVKTDSYGLYLGVYIQDAQLVAEPRSFHSNRGIKFNDRLDIRIADEGTLQVESIPKAQSGERNITSGKILFLDPLGAAQMQMLQAASGRCIMQLPYAYATMTNGTVGYSKYGDLWTDGMFIADTDIYDEDGGWGTEVFLPWSSLDMEYPKAGESSFVGVLISILDRNADPTDAVTKNSLRTSEGRAKSILADPSSYCVIETKGGER